MRAIIAGGRNFSDYDFLSDSLDDLQKDTPFTKIVSGKARGADSLGEKYGRQNNISISEFPANWDKYGKSAGYRRNVEMANNADLLVAFWDGKSKGTSHMINIAKEKGLVVHVVRYED